MKRYNILSLGLLLAIAGCSGGNRYTIELEITGIHDGSEAKYAFVQISENMWSGEKITLHNGIKTDKDIVPLNGWQDFEELITLLKLEDLPNQAELPDRSQTSPVGGENITLRVGSPQNMNEVFYSNPHLEIQRYWQSAHLLIFATYVQTEMQAVE